MPNPHDPARKYRLTEYYGHMVDPLDPEDIKSLVGPDATFMDLGWLVCSFESIIHEGHYPSLIGWMPPRDVFADSQGTRFQKVSFIHSYDKTYRHGEKPMQIEFPLTFDLKNEDSKLFKEGAKLPFENVTLRKPSILRYWPMISGFFNKPSVTTVIYTLSIINLIVLPFSVIAVLSAPSVLSCVGVTAQIMMLLPPLVIYRIIPFILNLEQKWREELSETLETVERLIKNDERDQAYKIFPKLATYLHNERFWVPLFRKLGMPVNPAHEGSIYTLEPIRPANWRYHIVLSSFFNNNAVRFKYYNLLGCLRDRPTWYNREMLESAETAKLYFYLARELFNNCSEETKSLLPPGGVLHLDDGISIIKTRPLSYYKDGFRYYHSTDNGWESLKATLPTLHPLYQEFSTPYNEAIQRCIRHLSVGDLAGLDKELMEMDKKGGVRDGFASHMCPGAEAIYLQLRVILITAEKLYTDEFKRRYYQPDDKQDFRLEFRSDINSNTILSIIELVEFLQIHFPDKTDLIEQYKAIQRAYNDNTKVANEAVISANALWREHGILPPIAPPPSMANRISCFLWKKIEAVRESLPIVNSYVSHRRDGSVGMR